MTEAREHDTPQSEDDPMASFLEMVRKTNETNGSKLYDLFEKEGDSKQFEELLDDIVYEIAFSDPTYVQNANKLKDGRVKGAEADEMAKRQREMVEIIRKIVIAESGLPTKELQTAIEQGQEAVQERLQGVDLSNVSTNEILRKLGILEEDENGDVTFNYPVDLFPEEITKKWNVYIDAVKKHIDVGLKVERGALPREDLEVADSSRRLAHNRISEDLHKILGFDKLPKESWDLESTRRLVAKMRDKKFVGEETKESVITSQALALGMSVLAKLSARTAKR